MSLLTTKSAFHVILIRDSQTKLPANQNFFYPEYIPVPCLRYCSSAWRQRSICFLVVGRPIWRFILIFRRASGQIIYVVSTAQSLRSTLCTVWRAFSKMWDTITKSPTGIIFWIIITCRIVIFKPRKKIFSRTLIWEPRFQNHLNHFIFQNSPLIEFFSLGANHIIWDSLQIPS